MQSVFNYAATELLERNDMNCQICLQNSKLHCSQAPRSGTFSWCGVTPDNYLFLTMTIGHQDPIGHPPPSPQQPRALNPSQKASLSDLSPFTSAILWSRGNKDQFRQKVVCAKTGRPPLLGHGEEISIVVSCSYYSSYSYFSPCSSYVLLSPGQFQI